MDFKSTYVLKYPIGKVWKTMRDELSHFTVYLDDIESITVTERKDADNGDAHIVNVWQAAPNLPAFVANQIKKDMLAWTDNADWHGSDFTCHWVIEPHVYRERINCKGETRFEEALGGAGTKISFSGSIELDASGLGGELKFLSGFTGQIVEIVVHKLIPNNFVKLAKALAQYLDSEKTK